MAYVRRRMLSPPRRRLAVLLALVAGGLSGCSREPAAHTASAASTDAAPGAAVPGGAATPGTSGSPGGTSRASRGAGNADAAHPLLGLQLGADEVAARVGSFAWEAEVRWFVEKPGASPVRVVERHRVRQSASGEFEASAEIDPGGGPGSEEGKHVVLAGGKVYARGQWAPYRERPSDRGQEARRVRDDSFRLAGDVAALLGPRLVARPVGDATHLHRRVRRFELALAGGAPADATRAAPPSSDPDTVRRQAFLEGRIPTAASGELLVDAATGAPVAASIRGAFAVANDPAVKTEVEVTARIRAIGRDAAVVHAPAGVLPDDRKPKGVARALEAAGLRKRGAPPAEREEEDEEER